MNKAHRHRLIVRILQANTVKSQEQLRDLLLAGGVRATQGTLSRDLREMGVVKAPTGYSLAPAADNKKPDNELQAALHRYMVSVEPAGSIVVVRTEAGCANALATQIDLYPMAGIVGSVAGDDTIFLAASSPRVARAVALQYQRLGGLL